MALTRDFKETIRACAERDPRFRKELLREGIDSMLSGDIATAKIILRDFINATIGFTELAEATRIPSKPYADARPHGESASGQSLRCRQLPTTPRGPALPRNGHTNNKMIHAARPA